MRKRLVSLDILRMAALLAVFFTHLMVESAAEGGLRFFSQPIYTVLLDSLSLSGVAVALFFLLSGFCLALSFEKRPLKPGKYYLSRFFRLLVPFYLLSLAAILYELFLGEGWNGIRSPGVPLPFALFSLLGMDGFLHTNGLPSFTTVYIGEWFLGILVLLSLLFPLLLIAARKCGKWGGLAAGLLLLLLCIFNPFSQAAAEAFLPNFLLFFLGICFFLQKERLKSGPLLVTGAAAFMLTLIYVLSPPEIKDRLRYIKTITSAVFLLLLFLRMEGFFVSRKRPVFDLILRYSYGIYLSHHKIQLVLVPLLASFLKTTETASWPRAALFVLLLGILSFGGSLLAAWIIENISALLKCLILREKQKEKMQISS